MVLGTRSAAKFEQVPRSRANMPYTARLNLASYYKHHSGHASDDYEETGAVPVFNADFKEVVAAGAKKLIEDGNFLGDR